MQSTVNTHQFSQIKHLRQFFSPNPLFIDADSQNLPQFFLTNLVDDSRVVKCFLNDPQANIKIFYYQYLKLCFEIDNVDYESYIEKIYELIRTEGFQFYFDNNDPQKEQKNAQFKSLLVDFFEIMNSSSLNIDTVLTQYPILNQVFTNFFRTVVMIASITPSFDSYIQKNELFDFLSSFFSVDISSYDKCLKFVQSDIFVFEENQQKIYMAYIKDQQEEAQQSYQTIGGEESQAQSKNDDKMKTVKEDEQENEVSNTTDDNQQHPQIGIRLIENNRTMSKQSLAPSSQQIYENSLKPRAKTIIKESYIEGEFADYTSFNHNLSGFGKSLTTQVEKEVYIQCLEPNTTVNDNEDSEKHIDYQRQTDHGQKQLKKVQSAKGNILYLANRAQSIEYDEFPPNQRPNYLSKIVSNPNLLSSQNNHKMAESCYDSVQSKFQVNQNEQTEQEDLTNSKASGRSKTIKKNNLYVNYEEPTKDPGFANYNQEDFTGRPVESMYSHHNNELTEMNHESRGCIEEKQEKPFTYDLTHKKYTSQYTYQQPLFHKPSVQSPIFLTQNNLLSNGRTVSSSNSQKQQFSYHPPITTANPYSTQKFKLNVTKEFTNSFVMKSMPQPYKSTVYQIRQRAREFRKNIYQQNSCQQSGYSYQGEKDYGKKSSRTNLPSESTIAKPSSSNLLWTETNNNLKDKLAYQYSSPMNMMKTGQKVDSEERIGSQMADKVWMTGVKQINTEQSRYSSVNGSNQQQNQPQSSVTVSIYQQGSQTASKHTQNSTYQPFHLYQKQTNPSYPQQSKIQQTPQPFYQQIHQPLIHNPQHNLNKPNTHMMQSPQLGLKTYPQVSLLSHLPQPQKPLPLYVPFERRK